MIASTTQKQGYDIVTLKGPFDIESVADCRPELEALSERSESGVILSMSGVTFLDSSGVGALVFLFKRLNARKARLHLVGLTGQPLKLIRLLRIHQTISVHDELEDVLQSSKEISGQASHA